MTEPVLDPILELLEPPPALELKEPRLGAIDVKWTSYRGARKPCDHCVQLIHERGVAGAPPASSATAKRKGPNDDLFLCALHAQEMREKDAAVTTERDSRLAHAEHLKKAARSR
jgi:hypothetical protein